MSAVFADTIFYVALLSPRDRLHNTVTELAARSSERTVTTEFVLLEVANFFKEVASRQRFAALVKHLSGDPLTTILPCGTQWFQRGMDLYSSRADKQWSLTDCISFVVMQEQGLIDALTADRHFVQAGFNALLPT